MIHNAMIAVLTELEYSGAAHCRCIPVSLSIRRHLCEYMEKEGLLKIQRKSKTIYITEDGLKFLQMHRV
jgi:hypothetical protein